MNKSFWDNLDRPIIGLAPMDGVTDVAFRQMVCRHSKPSVLYTEFVNVEGLARGATKMLHAFRYEQNERPIVAQVFGVEVESFYKAAVMLCSLGFDGVDINMGCPVNKVAKKGSGAGLIQTPDLAREIIRAVKKGCKDWNEGISLEDAGVHEDIIIACNKMRNGKIERRLIPVSVKTRIGTDKPITEEWISTILEEKPDCICLHGRTLKQLYSGEADWDEISKAAKLCRDAGVCFLGNGDVKSFKDAKDRVEQYGVDGILIGRAATGNPWFFGNEEPSMKKMFNAVLEHCEIFEELLSDKVPFVNIKKHLAWYCKGFDGARELRMKLMACESKKDVEKIIPHIL
ncbi:tRNA-dihydrouridine synthase [Candidatus Peregrinibacteria bacterium]|jgi:tRNA-dihydrouridine synthase B|nr:tRNA-dihydrouridine synthase [Candidatus Peregrinibacteria bacterium]MBT7736383.1 tRNA-dihydrouridine synthase [Candidatus Peregrinibacteria bacterium]